MRSQPLRRMTSRTLCQPSSLPQNTPANSADRFTPPYKLVQARSLSSFLCPCHRSSRMQGTTTEAVPACSQASMGVVRPCVTTGRGVLNLLPCLAAGVLQVLHTPLRAREAAKAASPKRRLSLSSSEKPCPTQSLFCSGEPIRLLRSPSRLSPHSPPAKPPRGTPLPPRRQPPVSTPLPIPLRSSSGRTDSTNSSS